MTGLLTTSGSQFRDWSATYRLFSEDRLPVPELFSVVRRAVAAQLPAAAPFRAVLDDTLLRRSGLHIPGVAWRRDPLGPRFQTNFVRGQRFLQISAAIRKDARLYFTPDPALMKTRGRRLRYGAGAPTPDQFRTDETEPWLTMTFTHSGIAHQLRYKRRQNMMWRTAGAQQTLQLIVIAPLACRLRKGSKLLYRDPGYLICTDPELDSRQIIEAYFQRWDIEVNFRDEKTLLGVGQAQVRAEVSVESAPALTVAAYGMMLVSAERAFGNSREGLLPQPKWAASSQGTRISTQQLLHQLRAEVWGRGLGIDSFSGFASSLSSDTKPEKCSFPIASAVCYANG